MAEDDQEPTIALAKLASTEEPQQLGSRHTESLDMEFPDDVSGFWTGLAKGEAAKGSGMDLGTSSEAQESDEQQALEQLQGENEQLKADRDESERHWKAELSRLQEQHTTALTEFKQWYKDELQQMRANHEAEVTAANQQATDAWTANREAVADFTKQMQAVRADYEAKLQHAHALQQQQNTFGSAERHQLVEQHQQDMVHMAMWMQDKYDKMETELLEALNQIDDMELEIQEEQTYWKAKMDRMTQLQQEIIAKLEQERDAALEKVKQLELAMSPMTSRSAFVKTTGPLSPRATQKHDGSDVVGYFIDPKTGEKVVAKIQSPSGQSLERLRSPTSAFGVVRPSVSIVRPTPNKVGVPNQTSIGSPEQVGTKPTGVTGSRVSREEATPVRTLDIAAFTPAGKENGHPNDVARAIQNVKEKIEFSTAKKLPSKATLATPKRLERPPSRAGRVAGDSPRVSFSSMKSSPMSPADQERQYSASAPTTPSRLFQPTAASAAKKSGPATPATTSRLSRPTASSAQRVSATKGVSDLDKKSITKLHAPRHSMLAPPKGTSRLAKPTSRLPVPSKGASELRRSSLQRPSLLPNGSVKKAVVSRVTIEPKQKSLLTNYGQPGNRSSILPNARQVALPGSRTTAARSSRAIPASIAKRVLQTPKPKVMSPKAMSPSEILENVLNCLSAEKMPVHKAPMTPSFPTGREITIDETPRELQVEEKFESLFSTWTTDKKAKPERDSMAPVDMPSMSLFAGWSTAKKSKRGEASPLVVSSTSKRHKVSSSLRTPSRQSQKTLSTPCETPLFVRGEIVDVFSPEELLLSPAPTTRMMTPSARKMKAEHASALRQAQQDAINKISAATRLQAHARQRIIRKTFIVTKKLVIVLQSRWRSKAAALCKNEMLKAVVTIQSSCRMHLAQVLLQHHRNMTQKVRADASVFIQRVLRGMWARCQYADMRMALSQLEAAARDSAAVHLQQIYRGFLARRRYAALKSGFGRNASVTTIQRVTRGMLTRVSYRAARELEEHRVRSNSVVMIQRVYRGLRSRRARADQACEELSCVFAEMQKTNACIVIQCASRAMLARRQLPQLRATQLNGYEHAKSVAAVVIQCACRSMLARVRLATARAARIELEQGAQLKAATAIQRLFRGRATRKKLSLLKAELEIAKMMVRVDAATAIQSTVRRLAARRDVAKIRLAIAAAEHVARVDFTTDIQRLVRGFMARQVASVIRSARAEAERASRLDAATLVQCLVRGFMARQHVSQLRATRSGASLIIQTHWRMFLSRSNFQEQLRDITIVQSLARRLLAQRGIAEMRYARECRAATCIQRYIRGGSSRLHFARIIRCTIMFQSAARGWTVRRFLTSKQSKANAAALLIQKNWRVQIHRATFLARKASSMKLQSSLRGYQVRQQCSRMRRSAIKIQSSARCYLVQQRILHENKAAVMIQKIYRGNLLARGYDEIWQSTVIVQSMARRFLAMRSVQALSQLKSASATSIQAHWRGHSTKQRYQEQGKACATIQTSIRCWRARATLEQVKLAKVAQNVKTVAHPVRRSRTPLGDLSLDEKKGESNKSSLKKGCTKTDAAKRKPLGDASLITVADEPTKPLTKVRTGHENAKNAQATFSSPMPVKQSTVEDTQESDVTGLGESLEKLRVVDLRDILLANGVEKKDLRNVRKAALIEMVVARGCQVPT